MNFKRQSKLLVAVFLVFLMGLLSGCEQTEVDDCNYTTLPGQECNDDGPVFEEKINYAIKWEEMHTAISSNLYGRIGDAKGLTQRELNSVTKIHISGYEVENFVDIYGLFKFTELKELIIEDANLQSIQGVQYYYKLERLNLSGNNLGIEDLEIINSMTTLRHLNISENYKNDMGLRFTEENNIILSDLEELIVSNNSMDSFEFNFILENYPSLTYLDFSGNYLEGFEDVEFFDSAISYPTNLTYLDISDQYLDDEFVLNDFWTVVEEVFVNLETLVMEGNMLEKLVQEDGVEFTDYNLDHLSFIDLDNNDLDTTLGSPFYELTYENPLFSTENNHDRTLEYLEISHKWVTHCFDLVSKDENNDSILDYHELRNVRTMDPTLCGRDIVATTPLSLGFNEILYYLDPEAFDGMLYLGQTDIAAILTNFSQTPGQIYEENFKRIEKFQNLSEVYLTGSISNGGTFRKQMIKVCPDVETETSGYLEESVFGPSVPLYDQSIEGCYVRVAYVNNDYVCPDNYNEMIYTTEHKDKYAICKTNQNIEEELGEQYEFLFDQKMEQFLKLFFVYIDEEGNPVKTLDGLERIYILDSDESADKTMEVSYVTGIDIPNTWGIPESGFIREPGDMCVLDFNQYNTYGINSYLEYLIVITSKHPELVEIY